MTAIAADSVIRRKTNHFETELDGETILMHVASGDIFGLADTAREIWARIAEPVRCDQLVAGLSEEFAVAPGACRADVCEFLTELEHLDLIELSRRET